MRERYRITVEATPDERGMYVHAFGCGLTHDGFNSLDPEKLPPRARPVRKGDEIEYEREWRRTFIAVHEGTVFYTYDFDGGRELYAQSIKDMSRHFTHTDGAEIDWEASE